MKSPLTAFFLMLYAALKATDMSSIPINMPHDTAGTNLDEMTMISTLEQQAMYGMFPNNGQTFSQRLQLAKASGCNAFRDNFDAYTTAWKVELVHDSALYDLMTYNHSSIKNKTYFPTGQLLDEHINTLNNYMQNGELPELMSFNNEEPNKNYWKGTPQDYLIWLNAATAIAHSYGVPVSNGGLLTSVVFYVRWVYEQEGKTDSVNLINALTGGLLPPNSTATAIDAINWYKVEIPGLAASQIDYVNFHWYEPPYNYSSDNITTTSGLLPIVIQFLASRTEKPVITTEFGTGNENQALFNATATEIKNAGVNIMVYYAGEGPRANYHPEWWKEWITAGGMPFYASVQ